MSDIGTKRWRNGPHGYGLMTKTLHWTIALAMVAQFIVGYLLDGDSSGHGRGRGRGRGGESGRGRGRGGDDRMEIFGDDTLLTVHVVLGIVILTLAIIRLIWRLTTPLPPWATTLSAGERRLAHLTESALYLLMLAIPISGLILVLSDDDDLVGLHIGAHIAFFVVIAAHIGLVLKHQLVNRDRLLRRML